MESALGDEAEGTAADTGHKAKEFTMAESDEAVDTAMEQSVHGRQSPVASVVSMASDSSMHPPLKMSPEQENVVHGRQSPTSSVASMMSDLSIEPRLTITPEQKKSQTAESAALLCDVCPKTAFKSCLTCMASFCGDHVKPHYTAPALQRHRLVEATEDLEQRLCQRHNRELELYCNTDQTAICALCVVKKHKGHNIIDLGKDQEKQIKLQDVTKTTDALTDLRVMSDIPASESLSCVEKDLTSLLVSWNEPAGVDQATYLLTLCHAGKCLRTVPASSLQYTFSGLDIDREYCISVSTVLEDRHSSPICIFMTTSAFPVPQKVAAVSVTPTSADLSWSLQQRMERIPHKFLISYSSEGAEPQTISTESCTATLTGLQPDTQYAASVYCELEDGRRSEASSVIIVTGTFAPTDLSVAVDRAESGNHWKADLSWSLQQGMEQGQHKFLISYCSEGAEPQTISTKSCSTTLTGLQPDTTYTASVCSVTQRGEKTETVSTTFHTSEWRIVLLGKSGDGKSSTGNTVLGEDVFKVDNSWDAVTEECEAHSRTVNGRKITLVDTPGFLDATTVEDIRHEIPRCLSLSSPGPHAFILVLKVGRSTAGGLEVINQTVGLFTSRVFRHSVIVFTHGNELRGQTLQQFVERSQGKPRQEREVKRKAPIKDLINECGGRYHVIDNKHWKQVQEGEYSNRRQIEKLFDTIDKMVQSNGGGYYTQDHVAGETGYHTD